MEDSQLPENRSAIVVDLLSGQAIVSVEGVNTAERNLDSPSGCGQSSPVAEVRPANNYFDYDGIIADMRVFHLNNQIWQRRHQLRIETADAGNALVVLFPSFVYIASCMSEGQENAFKVMRVFKTN